METSLLDGLAKAQHETHHPFFGKRKLQSSGSEQEGNTFGMAEHRGRSLKLVDGTRPQELTLLDGKKFSKKQVTFNRVLQWLVRDFIFKLCFEIILKKGVLYIYRMISS